MVLLYAVCTRRGIVSHQNEIRKEKSLARACRIHRFQKRIKARLVVLDFFPLFTI